MIVHWDDVEAAHESEGTIEFDGFDLGEGAGSVEVGVTRARVKAGKQSSPVHVEVAEEEIFYVLDGTGLSWQNGETFEVRAGDCIVHKVGEEAHTLIGGAAGLDVLAFGERAAPALTWLPRPRVARMGISLHVPPLDPWALEAAEGELELPEPSRSRANIVNVDEVDDEGDGALELTPSPAFVSQLGAQPESHPVRAGHVVSRPAGTRISHAFRGGDHGLTMLAYGQRRSNDITYYPRSNKISFRGVGLIARIDHVRYQDGEESCTE